jgi:hypothetical protein
VSGAVKDCVGQAWSGALAELVEARAAAAVAEPLSDHQGDGAWRQAMAGVMARRAVNAAVVRAKSFSKG